MSGIRNSRVLVLNASYTPIGVCSVERAMVLLYLEKVELVAEEALKKLRSAMAEFPFPTVVRVLRQAAVPFKKVQLTKRNIFRRDDFKCQYCTSHVPQSELTVDHILPRSRGGEDTWTNLITACRRCNLFKDDRTPEEAQMKLRKRPTKPNHIMFLKTMSREVSPDWEPYLFT